MNKDNYISKGTMEQKEFVDAMFTKGGIEKIMTTNPKEGEKEDFEQNAL